jgi:hypothetical protein
VSCQLRGPLFGLSTAALLTGVEELPPPGFGADLPHRDLAASGLTSPDISEWSAAFEHQPCQVWQGVKQTARTAAQPLRRAKILRTIPQEPTIVPIQGQTGLHPDINSQQERHGVYPPQHPKGMLDIAYTRML